MVRMILTNSKQFILKKNVQMTCGSVLANF